MNRRRKLHAIFGGAIAGALLISAARADDITLKNGTKYSGSISRQGDVMIIRTDDGKVIAIQPTDIASVNLTDSRSPEQIAAAEWTRVAQEIKAADALQMIIGLHRGFLEKFPDTAIAKEVQSSMGVYEALSKNDGGEIPRAVDAAGRRSR